MVKKPVIRLRSSPPTACDRGAGMVELNRVEQLLDGVLLDLRTDLLPAPRPRLSPRGAYLPKQYRVYRNRLADVLRDHIPPLQGVCCITATVFREIENYEKRYGDVDNLAKTILDALPFDDQFVCELRITKRTGKPRVLLSVDWGVLE